MPDTARLDPVGAALRRIALAAACIVFAWPAAALDPRLAVTQYRRDTWTSREGLPQSSVEAIAQTPDGYLWLGTQEGLVLFDGVRFVVFDKATTPALRHNRVTALLAARDGSLWIGTEGGGVTRLLAGAFDHLDGLPSPAVRALGEDASGAVWAGTDAGLARFSVDRFAAGPTAEGLARRPVLALHAGRGGLWVGLRDGAVRVDAAGVTRLGGGLPQARVNALWEDLDGTLWLGGSDDLFVRRPGEEAVAPVTLARPHPHVTALCRDRDGVLWAGTDEGVLRLGDALRHGAIAAQRLSNDRVQHILEDREGSLWIGTQDGGVTRLAQGRFTTWSAVEGLAADIAWPILGDRDGSLWIGTKSGGVSHFRDGRFETYSTANGLAADSVQSLAQTPDGALWVGTRSAGLDRIEGGRFSHYGAKQGIVGDSVSVLATTRAGRLWVATRSGGLCYMDAGRCVPWSPGTPSLVDVAIYSIVESRDGSLWIGTNGAGLLRLSPDGQRRAYTTRDGLSADIVNIVHEDAEGTLWVGTYGGGLNRLRGDHFTSYTTSQGLYDDAIFSILEDSRGRLWMSCNKGVFRVDKQELDDLDRGVVTRLHPVAYGVEDGMKDRECNGANFPPAWKDPHGRLWFPTIQGVASVDPEKLPVNSIPIEVNLEQVVVDGRSAARSGEVVLAPGARNVEFHYAAPSFVVPGRVRYRYRLEGLDPDWVDAGARRVAYYSRLPPGHFRFRVAAANEDGVWNEEGTTLAVRLLPRLYQTPWFAAACAAVLGAAVWSGDRLRTRRRAAREAALESLVEERTRDLAEANLRLERLSALDGLTGVANRRRFDDVLSVEWRRGCRSGEPLSLILMDLDFFKPFNDTNGHLAGDEALRQVAGYLSGTLGRAGDLVARFGGEEFVALLPGMSVGDATALAERLRAGVFALALPHNASAVANVVTLSAGVASVVPTEDASPQTLVATADAALYKAKRDGRNVVKVAG